MSWKQVRGPARPTVVLGVDLRRNLAEYELRAVRHRLGLVRARRRMAGPCASWDGTTPACNDWGTTAVEVYNEVGAASEPAKIKARYDLGSMDVQLHGWVKQGVLVLALFRRFKDESGGSNYFDREFFYRTDEPRKAAGKAHGLCAIDAGATTRDGRGWLPRGPRGT